MVMHLKKITLVAQTTAFVIFVLGFALLFLIEPRLGPHDDYIFLKTLQEGKPLFYYSSQFPYYSMVEWGRFTPLVSLEYNLVGLYISNKPLAYFAFHALQFIFFAILIVRLLYQSTRRLGVSYGASVMLFLTPAFAIPWFRLQLPERNALFFIVLFLLLFERYVSSQRLITGIAAVVSATLAIYYKETSFIIIGVFAVCYWYFLAAKLQNRIRNICFVLVVNSLAYLALYYIFVIQKGSKLLYLNHSESSALISFLKMVVNYIATDPFLWLVALPLVCFRVSSIVRKKDAPSPLYDAMLISGATFMISYLILQIYAPYYLLMAYAVVVPPIFYFLFRFPVNATLRYCIACASLVFLFNTLPNGIHYISYNKYLPLNFSTTLDFLSGTISREKSRSFLYLDGVPLDNGGRNVHAIFALFLESRGFTQKNFDLVSEFDSPGKDAQIQLRLQYGALTKGPGRKIKKGDYLIITPQSSIPPTNEYIAVLLREYNLLFRTQSKFMVPNYSIKRIVKTFMVNYLPEFSKSFVQNQMLEQPVDYYVFQKRA